jgi:hypothetical protein
MTNKKNRKGKRNCGLLFGKLANIMVKDSKEKRTKINKLNTTKLKINKLKKGEFFLLSLSIPQEVLGEHRIQQVAARWADSSKFARYIFKINVSLF